MFEKYQVANPRCSHFHNVDVEAPVMLHQCADVEAHFAMGVPRSPVFWFDVRHDRASKGCKQFAHIVVLPVYVCIRQNLGGYVALPQGLTVSSAGRTRWHQSESGNLSSTLLRIATK